MPSSSEAHQRRALWIERLVWNALAALTLTLLVGVLLFSLHWLDRIAPRDPVLMRSEEPGAATPLQSKGRLDEAGRREARAGAQIGRPSG
jgi:hypothetical protein